jgi:hypothetical protein
MPVAAWACLALCTLYCVANVISCDISKVQEAGAYVSVLSSFQLIHLKYFLLTLILLTWRIWWAPNTASRWQMGFNLAFKGSNNQPDVLIIQVYSVIKLYMFRAFLCPSSGVFYCSFSTGKFHAGLWWLLPSRVRMEQYKTPDDGHRRCP